MWQLLVILLCLIFNGIIAGIECAFVSISKPRLKLLAQKKDPKAERLLSLRENPEKTLSVLQLGITFVGVIAAAVGGIEFNDWAAPWIAEHWGLSLVVSEILSILFFVVPYTLLSIVFSELLPKTLALNNPKLFLFRFEPLLNFLTNLSNPVVYFLEKLTKLGMRLLPMKFKEKDREGLEWIPAGKRVHPYMLRLADVEKKTLRDVMVPWDGVDRLSEDASPEQVKEKILATGHTRLPILAAGKPMCLLQTKEFMSAYLKGNDKPWQSLLHPCLYFEEEASLVHALKEMQKERTHLSVVMRDQEPLGIVTIEDILEEVVGEIYDEDDLTN